MTFPVELLLSRLESCYGKPADRPRTDPVDELVSCILSQHTTDATSFPTFDYLKKKMPAWDDVVEAGPEKLAEVIRRAGLANQKARTILSCLNQIKSEKGYSLDHLAGMEPKDARDWLTKLPGVGPKTASIVLCFSFGMGVVPVDTHVFRVAWRVGLIPEGMDANKAHDVLLGVVRAEDAFRFHMDLIVHGRGTCKAPLPDCSACPVTDLCRWYREGGPDKRRAELSGSRAR